MPRSQQFPYYEVSVVDLDGLSEPDQRLARRALAHADYGGLPRPNLFLQFAQSAALGLLAEHSLYCCVLHRNGLEANYLFAGPGDAFPEDSVPGYLLMFGDGDGTSWDDHWFSEATGLSSDATMVLLGPACETCQDGPVLTHGGQCVVCRSKEKAAAVDLKVEVLPCPV